MVGWTRGLWWSKRDKKLSHVNRGASSTKPVDGAGGAAGLDTMAEAPAGSGDAGRRPVVLVITGWVGDR
eukprot:Skav227878  [mRNA]  locus=scaffold2896:282608:283249:+ [translate_table: standard]